MQCGCITAYVLKYYTSSIFFAGGGTLLDDVTRRARGTGCFPGTLFKRILALDPNPFFCIFAA